jgi:glutamate synthase domain-containing protein 3
MGKKIIIDAKDLNYRDLNSDIKEAIRSFSQKSHTAIRIDGKKNVLPEVTVINVFGQRYIGDGIKDNVKIKIHGTPGNDLAAFMDGPEIEVFGNCQDGAANTMNSGRLIVHGDCGDILGYSMRGGEVYVRGNLGWRSGIHMKSYMDRYPVIVAGGRAGNFLGEYMAGGIIILLGLGSQTVSAGYSGKFYNSRKDSMAGGFLGTGMHGGAIFLRGDIEDQKLGKEVKKAEVSSEDAVLLERYLKKFCIFFGFKFQDIIEKNFDNFIKLAPFSHRPYGRLYAY